MTKGEAEPQFSISFRVFFVQVDPVEGAKVVQA